MAAELRVSIIVLDTGPLITLAVADALDYLLYPGVPVLLPDAVLYEATRQGNALGAVAILEWAQAHAGRVTTISTETFFNHVAALEARPGHRERDLGERAALEAVHDAIHLADDERALLLTEDDRVLRRILVLEAELTQRMIPITTRDFLLGLEATGRINAADEIYRRVEDAGRLASRRTALADQQTAARAAVEALLRRP